VNRASRTENVKTRSSREEDSMLNISVQDISRIEVSSSTNSTPRDHNEGSSSEPSGVSFEDTVMGSDMTGSSFNSDDDF
jgi:hypothetical protein